MREVRVLAGGTHACTYQIRTAGPQQDFVLRELPPGDDAAGREARVLTALDGLLGLAPRLLAWSADEATSDGSWLLISRLPGAADITPGEPAAFASQLGTALARIHATPQAPLAGLPVVSGRPGGSPAALSGPAASLVCARWESIASAPAVLTHWDFWSGNTVWEDGRLTGVVDWSGAALGPRGFDLGWCRLDLYLLFDQRIADAFLASYEAARSNVPTSELLLSDLWAAARSDRIVDSWDANYRDLGRAGLTAAKLRRRHAAWTRQALARATDLAGF